MKNIIFISQMNLYINELKNKQIEKKIFLLIKEINNKIYYILKYILKK